MKLHAANLSPRVTEQRLKDVFETYGQVLDLELHLSNRFGRAFGYALVEMNFTEGLCAARTLNGQVLLNRRMYIWVCG